MLIVQLSDHPLLSGRHLRRSEKLDSPCRRGHLQHQKKKSSILYRTEPKVSCSELECVWSTGKFGNLCLICHLNAGGTRSDFREKCKKSKEAQEPMIRHILGPDTSQHHGYSTLGYIRIPKKVLADVAVFGITDEDKCDLTMSTAVLLPTLGITKVNGHNYGFKNEKNLRSVWPAKRGMGRQGFGNREMDRCLAIRR